MSPARPVIPLPLYVDELDLDPLPGVPEGLKEEEILLSRAGVPDGKLLYLFLHQPGVVEYVQDEDAAGCDDRRHVLQ